MGLAGPPIFQAGQVRPVGRLSYTGDGASDDVTRLSPRNFGTRIIDACRQPRGKVAHGQSTVPPADAAVPRKRCTASTLLRRPHVSDGVRGAVVCSCPCGHAEKRARRCQQRVFVVRGALGLSERKTLRFVKAHVRKGRGDAAKRIRREYAYIRRARRRRIHFHTAWNSRVSSRVLLKWAPFCVNMLAAHIETRHAVRLHCTYR